MNTVLSRALLVALLALPLAAPCADKTVPVSFAKGSTGTTLKGTVTGDDSVNYTIGAKAGQTLKLQLSGTTNAYFNLFAPGSDTAMDGAMQAQSFSGALPASGQYRVQVFQPRAQARRGQAASYSLRIDIPPTGAASSRAPAAATTASAGAAAGGLPLFNATCGPGIDVHVDQGGPVYIDGKEASLKKFNANYYEAKSGSTTISLSRNPDGTLAGSYTGAGGANGVCTPR